MDVARPTLEIRLLGQAQLLGDGAPLGFRAPARALSLLVYLLLHRDVPLARDAVAFTFWPDVPEPEARAKFRDYLRHLRASLPDAERVPWVLADKRTIRWNPDASIRLDVAEFERLAADPVTAAEAVGLYGGDLANQLDDEWLQRPRERLRELQSRMLSALIESSRTLDDPHCALGYAERLVQHDPWREDGVRALIELRHEMGNRAGALQTYHDFTERLRAELGVEPMPETVTVFERVLRMVELLPRSTVVRAKHNLPGALTSFVGREHALETLRALLADRRLVTLVGTGGVGKTRLALETARTVLDRFVDGVWFVEFGPLVDPALIVYAIASVLGLQNATQTSLAAAIEGKSMLLVLDNCEHLIEGAASIVERLLSECPQLHILATSREPLRVVGERTERVVSLALPEMSEGVVPSLEELQEAPAVRLFLNRAADVAPALRIREEGEAGRRALAAISHRLDGIPLAIEFAAARASSLSLEVLAQRLDDRFALLTAGRRTTLPRQQTLRATLDWSYDLLTTMEQRVLPRVGIFVGGWTLEAAYAVCGDDQGVTQSSVVESLAALVDKSLVLMDRGPAEPRYRLLETTRVYALERLEETGGYDRVARRHAEYFYALAERTDTTWQLFDWRMLRADPRLELDNWRVALKWAINAGNDPGLGALLVGSLRWFFATQALYIEGVRWCEAALEALGPDPQPAHEAAVQLALAMNMGAFPSYQRFYSSVGSTDRFLGAAKRAAELFRILADDARLSLSLSMVAMHLRLANQRGEADPAASEAVKIGQASERRVVLAAALYAKSFSIDQSAVGERTALLTEALEIARGLPGFYSRGSILMALGELAFEAGDPSRALAYARESRLAFRRRANLAQLEINIAAYSLALGECDTAHTAARDALAIGQQVGEPMIAATTFQLFAGVAAARADHRRAARLLGASDARLATGQPRLFTEQSGYDRTIAILHEALSVDELANLMGEGRKWDIDHAIQQAMGV